MNPTWNDNIGPLMADRCMGCHRDGGGAVPLRTYEDASARLASIRRVVEERTMPPWHAHPAHGDFANERRLSDHEVMTVLEWVDNGAPLGRGRFEPPSFPEPPGGYALAAELGPPDRVFLLAEGVRVPPDGSDFSVGVEVPAGLERDLWVGAVEVRGSLALRHALVTASDPRGGRSRLVLAAPGRSWERLPPRSARRLEAGSTLRLSLHYRPVGEAAVDTVRVAVWRARGEITHEVRSSVIVASDTSSLGAELGGALALESDASMTLLAPFALRPIEAVTFRLIPPAGRPDTLLYVPAYDLGWQVPYPLSRAVPVPAGAAVEMLVRPGPGAGGASVEGWVEYRVPLRAPLDVGRRSRQAGAVAAALSTRPPRSPRSSP